LCFGKRKDRFKYLFTFPTGMAENSVSLSDVRFADDFYERYVRDVRQELQRGLDRGVFCVSTEAYARETLSPGIRMAEKDPEKTCFYDGLHIESKLPEEEGEPFVVKILSHSSFHERLVEDIERLVSRSPHKKFEVLVEETESALRAERDRYFLAEK
jgi:hypothetical protein